MSDQVKKLLDEFGGNILREAGFDFEKGKNYDWIKKETDYKGYADYYLHKCWNYSKGVNEADAGFYQRLVDIDTNLGTDVSEQLACCLFQTIRWDLIKVWNFYLRERFEIILEHRF